MAQPFFSVCVEVDVTRLRDSCGPQTGMSFFLSTLYLMLRAANHTEAFRLRIRGEQVWLHDRIHVTSTVLRPDDTFAFGRFDLLGSFVDFQERGRAELERTRQVAPLRLPEGDDALIYHSTLPWFRFTSFTNAMDGGTDSVPRIVFGKCSGAGGEWRMPVAVEVHHALVDGLDVALFLEHFQDGLNDASSLTLTCREDPP